MRDFSLLLGGCMYNSAFVDINSMLVKLKKYVRGVKAVKIKAVSTLAIPDSGFQGNPLK